MEAHIESTLPKPFVFVLMPFDKTFDDIYKFGIKGAANEIGAYAERLDEQLFTEGMLDRIFNQISKADVIVADMTGRNPNVFYEVGYAHALGKIVLLLTQKTEDIPFDLKHRQHTVYGGSIDTLKSELVTKLQWAIRESRRRSQIGLTERFSIRLFNTIIPMGEVSDEIPIIRATTLSKSFELPLHVRNDSSETTSEISHVYLFCGDELALVPCEYKSGSFVTSWPSGITDSEGSIYTEGSITPAVVEPRSLIPFSANPIDAPDGLMKQFRLPITFPSLPPGAVEESHINLMFMDQATEVDSTYRIRLHSSTQYHDFPFTLRINYESDPEGGKPKRKKGSRVTGAEKKKRKKE